jgi:hypothetical protein
MSKDKRNDKVDIEISSNAVAGQPEDVFELINKYGTYEIQPTDDSDNKFPTISQGRVGKPIDNKDTNKK